MNKFFYSKIAVQNIKKNGKFYIPYILSCIGTVAGFYIMCAITFNEGISAMPGSASLQTILFLGIIVIGIFSTIFIFYTNKFLMTRRKKEIGLYNILGMEKRHISKILFWETILIGILSNVLGLVTGILLDKLVSLFLFYILDYEIPMGFYVSKIGMVITFVLFFSIFFLNLLSNLIKIKLAKPIELLHGGNVGEKEPKTRWLLAILGVLSLFGGYYIAITTESPLKALSLFFVAVLLVIVGTYCMFTACSITILKLLRRNKKFYYQTKHFISVSGMMYRMKQNAVGLSNICILSTMVLVMVSTTVSLYVGVEDSIQAIYPAEIMVDVRYTKNEFEQDEIISKVKEVVHSQGRNISNFSDYEYLAFTAGRMGDQFTLETGNIYNSEVSELYFISANEYNRLTGELIELSKNEVLLHSDSRVLGNSFSILNKKFEVVEYKEEFPKLNGAIVSLVPNYYIVVSDDEVLHDLYVGQRDVYQDNASDMRYDIHFDIDGTKEEKINCAKALRDANITGNYETLRIDGRQENKNDVYGLYGGFLFLGIFLGILFLMATALIIYYKQISEGYEDKARFEIMQKVGLSRDEIKSSINSQVLMVFFLPILTAVIHVMFAFKLITRLLALLHLTNTMLFLQSTVITILVFAVIYAMVYTLTSKIYYRIVS